MFDSFKDKNKIIKIGLIVLFVVVLIALICLIWNIFFSDYFLKQKIERQNREMQAIIVQGKPLNSVEKDKIRNYIGGKKVQDFQNNGVSKQDIDALIRAYNRK